MKKLNVQIQGMTCSSCEVIIERALKKVPGVQNVQVSRAKEKAYLHCDETVQVEDLQAAVADKGYKILPEDPITTPPKLEFMIKNKRRYAEIGAVLLFIIGAYLLLQQFNLIPQNLGVTDNMSYGFVLLIGLIAGTSTCLAVAGGLLLAVANKHSQANPLLTGKQKFQPHIYFNLGRIASYTLLGGAIGLLGSFLTISSTVTGIITIAASALMIIMGIQLLQIFPWANKIQLKMPKFIAHKVYDASHQENRSTSKTSSFLFGAATFFLPCGFTQALQLYVLGKGDFATGALTMLAFSLGTLPALAGVGAFSSFTKGKVQRHFTTFSAVLVIILGVFAMPSGLTLLKLDSAAGVGSTLVDGSTMVQNPGLLSVDPTPPSTPEIATEQVQKVYLEVRGLDYYPTKFTIKKGVPVEWTIDGRTAQGCARVLSAPALGITEKLSSDKVNVVTFTPTQTGTIMFSCSMGMAGPGTFEVI